MIGLIAALFCAFYVLSPDPLPIVIDDVIIAIIGILMWMRFRNDRRNSG